MGSYIQRTSVCFKLLNPTFEGLNVVFIGSCSNVSIAGTHQPSSSRPSVEQEVNGHVTCWLLFRRVWKQKRDDLK